MLDRKRQVSPRPFSVVADNADEFRQLVEQSVYGVLVCRDLRPLYANSACARVFGYQEGREILDLPSVESLFADRPLIRAKMAELLAIPASQIAIRLTCAAVRRDGGPVWADMLMQPIRWHGGRAVKCVISDVTEWRRQEQIRRRLQTELLENARLGAMRELSEAITHRLNQPRAAMLNYLNLARRMLQKGCAPEAVYETAAKILGEADRAFQILRGVEDMVGLRPEAFAPHDLGEAVREVYAAVAVDAAERGVRLSIDIEPDLPPALIIRHQLQQVVLRFLRAAVEAPSGGPPHGVAVRLRRPEGDRISVEIRDSAPPNGRPRRSDMLLGGAIIEAHGDCLRAEPNAEGGLTVAFMVPSGAARDGSD